jgi:hypothetical protein
VSTQTAIEPAAERRESGVPIPVASPRELLPYWIFAGLVLMLAIYFVGAEEGATSVFSGSAIHELVHDARHLLGFPCH